MTALTGLKLIPLAEKRVLPWMKPTQKQEALLQAFNTNKQDQLILNPLAEGQPGYAGKY